MIIPVKGPAARQFIKPALNTEFTGVRPKHNAVWAPDENAPFLQGVVCLPDHSPLFLTAENAPTYRSMHGFMAADPKGVIYQVGITPLIAKAVNPDFATYSFKKENLLTRIEIENPYIEESNFFTTDKWQMAGDGGIWGGLFNGFKHSDALPFMTRAYTLLRFNGEIWEIPSAKIINGGTEEQGFIEIKGVGLPFGVRSKDSKEGYVTLDEAILRYFTSIDFDLLGVKFNNELNFELRQNIDEGPPVVLRTGLPSTLRADAIYWGKPELEAQELRHLPEDLIFWLLTAVRDFVKIDRYQIDAHFQNFCEKWEKPREDSIEVELVPCDWGRTEKEERNIDSLNMPLYGLRKLIGEDNFTLALQKALARLVEGSLDRGLLFLYLNKISLDSNPKHQHSVFEILKNA